MSEERTRFNVIVEEIYNPIYRKYYYMEIKHPHSEWVQPYVKSTSQLKNLADEISMTSGLEIPLKYTVISESFHSSDKQIGIHKNKDHSIIRTLTTEEQRELVSSIQEKSRV